MKRINIITFLTLAIFVFPIAVFASGEVKLIESFAQCRDKRTKHTGGVLETPEALIDFLDKRVFDGAAEAVRIIEENNIDFYKQVVVWVLGKESKDYYDLKLKTSSYANGVLKTVLSEYNERNTPGTAGRLRKIQGINTRNPLYLYVTDPQSLRIQNEQGERLLRSVEFYQSGESEAFHVWRLGE